MALRVSCLVLAFLGLLCTLQGQSRESLGAQSESLLPQSINGSLTSDVIVYGATPAGIIAAVEAARHGKHVAILEPTQHIGGMSTNGLSASDLYNTFVLNGLPADFYNRINALYGRPDAAPIEARFFEPHVAEEAFQDMLAAEPNVSVYKGRALISAEMSGTAITGVAVTGQLVFRATEFIDASYTGDLMAATGVSYTVGREPASQYNETDGGVGMPSLPRDTNIDPYIVPGDPDSGLIAHVSRGPVGNVGDGDDTVMAYNYRVCLSSDPANQIPLEAPANYRASEFEYLIRLLATPAAPQQLSDFIGLGKLPHNKFDVNSGIPLSTDEPGTSFRYPDGSTTLRWSLEAEQKRYMLALFHFLATDPHVPGMARQQMKALGLCKDEFTDNQGWPHMIYVREARRMIGEYIFTENDEQLLTTIGDPIGLGGYPIDDHIHYFFDNGGAVFYENHASYTDFRGPYPIPYRILTPKASEVTNLLVPVDASASHVAFDSLRVEITWMAMGQAAGAAASLAIDGRTTVQNVDYNTLGPLLKSEGVRLKSYIQ